MDSIANWIGNQVEVAHSKGGVMVLVDPFANIVSGGVVPWPPSELIQKLYQSRQVRAFVGPDLESCHADTGLLLRPPVNSQRGCDNLERLRHTGARSP